jgi:hypothetical protein
MAPPWLALLAVLAGASAPLTRAVKCPSGVTSRGVSVQLLSAAGNAGDTAQSEISGVVVSSQVVNGQNIVWVHSDSGSAPQVAAYGIKTRGRLARLDFAKSVSTGNKDFEDIALGPCSGAARAPTCIFVSGTGNNAARDAAGQSGTNAGTIYRIREPALPTSIDVASPLLLDVTAEVIPIKYDQPGVVAADCETLMADANGDLYLTTKWNAAQFALVRVFRILAGAAANVQLTLKPLSSTNSALQGNTFTRGEISRDGALIVMGSTSKAFIWTRQPGQTVEQALNAEPCFTLPTSSNAQHEAISFGTSSSELFEVPEGANPSLFKIVLSGGDAGQTPAVPAPSVASPSVSAPAAAPAPVAPAPVAPAPVAPAPTLLAPQAGDVNNAGRGDPALIAVGVGGLLLAAAAGGLYVSRNRQRAALGQGELGLQA